MRKLITFMCIVTVVLISNPCTFNANSKARPKDYSLPIFSVEMPEKRLALTFNAAWDDADTSVILDILDAHRIRASFFLCGAWLNRYPDLLKQIYAAGHDVGNHGDTHAHVASLNFEGNVKEITEAHKKVQEILGASMNLYRAPYGEYNDTVLKAAESQDYTMIQWDVDSLDWMKGRSEEEVVNRVLNNKKLRNGSIILFHNDGEHTATVLERIIKGLKDKGFEFSPVSELIYKSDYYIDVEGRQHSGGVSTQ